MLGRILPNVTLGLCVLGLTASACKPKEPGEEAFDAATRSITSKDGGNAFGNTNACKDRAALLSEVMQRMADVGFSKEDKASSSISGGEPFRVHCQHSAHGMAFLIQVPRLEEYKEAMRTQLAKLAWKSSELVTQDLIATGTLTLGVGLHGKAFYGVVLSGEHSSDPEASLEGVASATPLFVFFDSPAAAETPIPQPLVDKTRAILSDSEAAE